MVHNGGRGGEEEDPPKTDLRNRYVTFLLMATEHLRQTPYKQERLELGDDRVDQVLALQVGTLRFRSTAPV